MNQKEIYRDANYGKQLVTAIRKITTRPWKIMDTCGGQTHAIARYRIEEMLPPEISLIHGPGCPVCVTPADTIDTAIELALNNKNVIISTFGDMMRVPGSKYDLLTAKSLGADIRIMYSPLDALKTAMENPSREVILFAIGFETTAPVHAQVVYEASKRKIRNLSLLTALFAVPPVLEHLFALPDFSVDGLLAAGHVCSITGLSDYHRLSRSYQIPISVTGFEPVDILYGIYTNIRQLEEADYSVCNAYSRMVPKEGNPKARLVLDEIFEPSVQNWRGLGSLPASGFKIKEKYKSFDTLKRYSIKNKCLIKDDGCIAGEIMKGIAKPVNCPHFGKACRPESPLGAAMVSSEGVCAAYYKYK